MSGDWIRWACPGCRKPLPKGNPAGCPECQVSFERREGIYRFLLPDRRRDLAGFVQDYETIRRKEGRALSPSQYTSLPWIDSRNDRAWEWRIRAASFAAFLGLLRQWKSESESLLQVCDLGAGNCWLSNRAALEGLQVAAVDILTNSFDGLGCGDYYDSEFARVEAEFDCLPFEGGQFDVVIFNASLHYSTDYRRTLEEGMRILRHPGRIVIIDSPVYSKAESGEQMVRERERFFQAACGIPSNRLPSRNFLTLQNLRELETAVGLEWEKVVPRYGLSWRLKLWRERIFGRREPARFYILLGTRTR